ncbi:hypothetical protein BYT27DRAFT_7184213 [Phlegmacium glaucopus]|nr:hypothetical protein BYT27DRAFT_7184213 [Phlegmacium glaucopus]
MVPALSPVIVFFGDGIKKNLRPYNASDSFEYLAANPKSIFLVLESTTISEGGDAMDTDVMEKQDPTVLQLPQIGEPSLRFSDTMMTMDNSAT